ncbi:MAG: NADP-dependent oxidoreductase [Prolixibacteraceae bacterium]|nr:NADP-dependent oxidoreductase [Prolixibacteraceae bacterium]
MEKMKAFTLKKNGGIENLELSEIDKPEINDDEVLIKVKAISINPIDTLVRQNRSTLLRILTPGKDEDPHILGWDVSGVIEKVGNKVAEFQKDDEVFGMINFPGHGKAYAEYVAAPEKHIALKPGNISFEDAAAATLAALTAWQGLVTHAKIKKGDKVLIHAAGGGVGHFAIQIAKSFGAYVIGTGSSFKKDFILKFGADEFIDYTKEKFEETINDADIVLDSIPAKEHLLRSIAAVKKGGTLISIKSYFEGEIAEKAKGKGLYTDRILVNSNGNDMKQIARLLEEEKINPHISERYNFEDLPKAHQQIETGKTSGKVVVVI